MHNALIFCTFCLAISENPCTFATMKINKFPPSPRGITVSELGMREAKGSHAYNNNLNNNLVVDLPITQTHNYCKDGK